ncbi:hypothetical protein [Leisingera aquimarina]|uniref:hypothetical protein n=1 Tax=Leisingera aquimarina TaxID=476529 RepID=UPI000405414C|nr:hypothetical protein [Leisingera aquimarina]
MTLVSAGSSAPQRSAVPQLLVTVAAVFALMLLAALSQLHDPMIRHDDYPALLADPELFYSKSLTEGRWVNYLWHLRGVVTPAWANFLTYQLLWAIYLGCLVHNALGREAEIWQRVMVALIAGLCLPSVLISLWFNTLIPGLAILALYGWLATRLSERMCRWLMLVFVPAALMSYTTYPFLVLAMSLTRADAARSAKDLAGLLVLFIASFALGMLAIYSLNYAEHGVFGVPMADWRNPSPATDLASALKNSKLAGDFLVNLVLKGGYSITGLALLQTALLGCAVWAVWSRDKWRALYMLSGAGLGLALICLQVIRSGIDMPVRSGGFLWAFGAIFVGLFALQLRDGGRARLSRNLLFGITALYVIFAGMTHFFSTEWNRLSQDMAAELTGGEGTVYVTGTYLSLEAANTSDLQKDQSVEFRLNYLTGRDVVMCESRPEACAGLPEELRGGLLEGRGFEVRHIPGGSVLMLSPKALREGKLEAARKKRQSDE